MPTTRSVVLVLVSTLGILAAGCKKPPAEESTPVRPVKLHTIGSLEPTAIREYPGTIRAFQTAEMGFEVPGRIEEFLVREGEPVEQGTILARLDPALYLAELDVAKANLNKAEKDLERSQNIRAQDVGAISLDEIEQNERAVEVTKAQLRVAQKDFDDTKLIAPFSGVMARKLVEDFANVQSKEPVLILQDTSALEIEVAVPERDFVRANFEANTMKQISDRLDARVIVSALPDEEFAAQIKEYATTADPVTRTFPVKLTFDNPQDVNILPGMTARAKVVIDPDSAWSVPVSAAQADENERPYVWKVDDQSMTVSKARVELGPLTGDRVLLTSGVEEGDLVAISGVTALRDGMQVREYQPSGEGDEGS